MYNFKSADFLVIAGEKIINFFVKVITTATRFMIR